jgi:hypothetical protein
VNYIELEVGAARAGYSQGGSHGGVSNIWGKNRVIDISVTDIRVCTFDTSPAQVRSYITDTGSLHPLYIVSVYMSYFRQFLTFYFPPQVKNKRHDRVAIRVLFSDLASVFSTPHFSIVTNTVSASVSHDTMTNVKHSAPLHCILVKSEQHRAVSLFYALAQA